MVVSNIFYFHPYLGKWSNLTNIFQLGWNHQLVKHWDKWDKLPSLSWLARFLPTTALRHNVVAKEIRVGTQLGQLDSHPLSWCWDIGTARCWAFPPTNSQKSRFVGQNGDLARRWLVKLTKAKTIDGLNSFIAALTMVWLLENVSIRLKSLVVWLSFEIGGGS